MCIILAQVTCIFHVTGAARSNQLHPEERAETLPDPGLGLVEAVHQGETPPQRPPHRGRATRERGTPALDIF